MARRTETPIVFKKGVGMSRTSTAPMAPIFKELPTDKSAIRPLRVNVPEAELEELRRRIEATRWPERETVGAGDVLDWSQGAPLSYMEELCAYWADGFDWRAQERRLNELPQLRAVVDGVGLHVVHARSEDPDAIPLLLLHGWPSTFAQMEPIIPLLTNSPGNLRTSCRDSS